MIFKTNRILTKEYTIGTSKNSVYNTYLEKDKGLKAIRQKILAFDNTKLFIVASTTFYKINVGRVKHKQTH